MVGQYFPGSAACSTATSGPRWPSQSRSPRLLGAQLVELGGAGGAGGGDLDPALDRDRLLRGALRREKLFDTISSNLMLVLAALPEFVVAVLLVILFVDHRLPPAARDQPRAARHAAVGLPRRAGPAGGHPGDRGRAVRLPDHAGLDDRGPRERLRRDGAAQGPARAHRADPARPAERDRPGLPGDRDQPRLPGRRRSS